MITAAVISAFVCAFALFAEAGKIAFISAIVTAILLCARFLP